MEYRMYHGEGKSLNRMNMQYKGEERLYAGGVGGGEMQTRQQTMSLSLQYKHGYDYPAALYYPQVSPGDLNFCEEVDARVFKTSLCRHFSQGFCVWGARCNFAHGQEELAHSGIKRNGQSNENDTIKEIVSRRRGAHRSLRRPNNALDSRNKQFKTQMCRHFAQGFCQLGDSCNFAHGHEELRLSRAAKKKGQVSRRRSRRKHRSVTDVEASDSLGEAAKEDQDNADHEKESELECVPIEEESTAAVREKKSIVKGGGTKSNEDAKSASHDSKRTRQGEETERKINTAMCRHFVHGFCKMGSRCRFAHGYEELLSAIPLSVDIRPAPRCTKDSRVNFRLCRHFSRTGQCRLSAKCAFAHGAEELRAWQKEQEAENLKEILDVPRTDGPL